MSRTQTLEPAPQRADNDWSNAPGCFDKDAVGRALLGTLKALWTHRRAIARYIRGAEGER